MDRTHTFDLYRRGSTAPPTEHRRLPREWGAPLLTAVPCNLQQVAGGVVAKAEGREAKVAALLFAHPNDMGNHELRPDDGVVIRSGPTVFGRFLVQDVRPQGAGPWDDEADLVRTTEEIP